MKRIAILGATGSIGTSGIELLKAHNNRYELVCASAHNNVDGLLSLRRDFKSAQLFITGNDAENYKPAGVQIGYDALYDFLEKNHPDVVLLGMPGTDFLPYFLRLLSCGIRFAMANKEIIISAGPLLKEYISKKQIIPVDSEQSAIFQCLVSGRSPQEVKRLILTCSGGPFRGRRRCEISNATVEEVISHPRWQMGRGISVDSATLMNKALEILEASALFDIPVDRIDVLVHPQAIIHSMVEFIDGNIIMNACRPDMRVPINYALSYPERSFLGDLAMPLADLNGLEFAQPDEETFTSLSSARKAYKKGGTALPFFVKANEAARGLFLEGRISFCQIMDIVADAIEMHNPRPVECADDIYAAENEAPKVVYEIAKAV